MSQAAAAKRKKADRRDLCERLLALRLKHADIFAEIESLKAELIIAAGELGEGFREVFVGRGQVTVAPPKPKEFKGHIPEIDPKIFDALTDARRRKLVDEGIVKVVPSWTRDFHGRVDVKPF
jgi:hypothetical protein